MKKINHTTKCSAIVDIILDQSILPFNFLPVIPMLPPYDTVRAGGVRIAPCVAYITSYVFQSVGVSREVEVRVNDRENIYKGTQHAVYLASILNARPHPADENFLITAVAEDDRAIVAGRQGKELFENFALLVLAIRPKRMAALVV